MKKILIRANMLPFDNPTMEEVFRYNLFGNNMGNLIYQASVVKTLMTDDDVEFTSMTFGTPDVDFVDMKKINSTYDCFVIPLANAFRPTFEAELRRLTRFVKKLKIPCYVIGVGAQASLDGKYPKSELDGVVRAFVKAVLEKSAIIGLRGEKSAEYLKALGFKEDVDYMVIGCPSLYFHGPQLPKADIKELTPNSRISVTRKNATPKEFHRFMNRQMEIFPDHWCVPQTIQDFAVGYAGIPFTIANYPKEKGVSVYMSEYDNLLYREDRAPTFLNMKTWIDFLKDKDFCFGSRIHGNIAPILAGVPAYILASDLRVMELAEYHNIPHTPLTEITRDSDIFALYEKADFDGIHRGHKERFDRYVSFLKKNDIPNIYDGTREYDELPFDKKWASIDFNGPEHSYYSLDEEGRRERTNAYALMQLKMIDDLRKSRARIARDYNKTLQNNKNKISLDEDFTKIVKKAAKRKLRKGRK